MPIASKFEVEITSERLFFRKKDGSRSAISVSVQRTERPRQDVEVATVLTSASLALAAENADKNDDFLDE